MEEILPLLMSALGKLFDHIASLEKQVADLTAKVDLHDKALESPTSQPQKGF